MSIVASELLLFASANRPTGDGTTTGGAIDLDWRLAFTQLAATDDLEAVSANAGDTMNCTLIGRSAAGVIMSETNALNGTTPVAFFSSTNAERFLRGSIASDAAGIVTIRRGTVGPTISTIPVGERGFTILFYDSASDPSATKTRYEKGFYKNTNGTLTLTNATVTLSADPSSKIAINLDDALDATTSATNRLTLPGSLIGSWQTVGVGIATANSGNLTAGAAQGVWFRQSLGIGDAPQKAAITVDLTGYTT